MNAREQGFLLLTSHLGDPARKPMTVARFRELAARAGGMAQPARDRELLPEDLTALGYSQTDARRILQLLSDRELLEYYLYKGRKAGCTPITRVSDRYPMAVRKGLGLDSPGCLWAKGDMMLLDTPCVALVGSRDLQPENRAFAREVGRQAALQGYTLVSGNARGADITAQRACLEAGGRVISVVADALQNHTPRENVLYLSEDSYDFGFSAIRALSRNRIIHCLGRRTFVAQCGLGMGGTWKGTCFNLAHRLSSVYCFRDGSAAHRELEQMGAAAIGPEELTHMGILEEKQMDLFGQ